MDDYLLINKHIEKYEAIIILLTQDSPFLIFNDIQNKVNDLNINGDVLIDQILRVGNTEERFISFAINSIIIDDTIKFEHIDKTSSIRKYICNYLNKYNLIDSSILSTVQKRMLKKGIAI